MKKLASDVVTLYHYDYAGNLIAERFIRECCVGGGNLPFGEAQVVAETVANNFRFPG